MLSFFPEILFLSPFAAVLIRLAVSILFAYSAWTRMARSDVFSRTFAVLEFVAAIGIFVGSWTQVAALLGAVLLGASLFMPKHRMFALSTLVLAIVMTLTLVITGPGPFAFDLPL